MDDLLQKCATAKYLADQRHAEDEAKAVRKAELQAAGKVAIEQLADRVQAVVDEFNALSACGTITVADRGRGIWKIFMPHTSNVLTLTGSTDTSPQTIRGKLCYIMATLTEHEGRSVRFLLFEDKMSSQNSGWVAVRKVTSNHGVQLDKVEYCAEVSDVIVPEFSNDVDAAIREMLAYGFSAS